MRILVVGSGGREHALCWSIAASPLTRKLFCAPGNAGIAQEAECVAIAVDDLAGIVDFARRERIDFVVVGPELPLVLGLVDRLAEAGIKAFGPRAAAAALEGSKAFMKDLCAKHGIPTAAYGRFRDAAAAKRFVRARGAPIVVKADGLAAGKGVIVAATAAEAEAAIDGMLTGGQFGAAGAEIVVEEFLAGEEASFFALTDGAAALPLASAQDHKRAHDGDQGPNTGGMGAYSPAPAVTETMAADIMARIIRPTIAAMAAEGRPLQGVLYAGLMLTADGPKLLEYNVRFGDPECQALCVRLMSDLLPALMIWIGRSIAEPAPEGYVYTEGAKATAMAGNIFAVAALVLGLAAAAVVVVGGIRLARRSHWRYCVFSAALLCLFVPLGTLLGGLVIARLLDPKGRAAFTS